MSKKENNKNKKNNSVSKKEEKKMAKVAKETQQTVQDCTIIGATTHGFIYQKPMPDTQIEVVDLGKFGKRSMKWGKGLECSKVFDGDKEVAYIFWEKSGKSPRIRLLSEEQKRYYMLSYNQDNFFYYEGDKQMTVNDQTLRNALWFFHKNFVLRLAELKNWKLPEKRQPYYNDKGYWEALEREHEQEEAYYAARKNSKNNG